MWRFAVLGIVLGVGCGDSKRQRPTGPTADAPVDVTYVVPDAPPPSVDAAPPPVEACQMDAGQCQLPPSTCLDTQYLVYYTGGDCVDGTCRFMTNVMYCGGWGCQNGGCVPAFT